MIEELKAVTCSEVARAAPAMLPVAAVNSSWSLETHFIYVYVSAKLQLKGRLSTSWCALQAW